MIVSEFGVCVPRASTSGAGPPYALIHASSATRLHASAAAFLLGSCLHGGCHCLHGGCLNLGRCLLGLCLLDGCLLGGCLLGGCLHGRGLRLWPRPPPSRPTRPPRRPPSRRQHARLPSHGEARPQLRPSQLRLSRRLPLPLRATCDDPRDDIRLERARARTLPYFLASRSHSRP